MEHLSPAYTKQMERNYKKNQLTTTLSADWALCRPNDANAPASAKPATPSQTQAAPQPLPPNMVPDQPLTIPLTSVVAGPSPTTLVTTLVLTPTTLVTSVVATPAAPDTAVTSTASGVPALPPGIVPDAPYTKPAA
jgi:hypothetical protein